MKTPNDLFSRLKKMMPEGTRPKFANGQELLAWNQEQGRLRSEAIVRENRAMKMQRVMGRSGIRELHINCSFDNYRVENEGQRKALELARQYAAEFDGSIASFVFSGRPGTGKNHLAAAIGNDLILRGKSEEITARLAALQPVFMDSVPLTLEEIFIYELGGADHEISDLVV